MATSRSQDPLLFLFATRGRQKPQLVMIQSFFINQSKDGAFFSFLCGLILLPVCVQTWSIVDGVEEFCPKVQESITPAFIPGKDRKIKGP